MLITTFALIQVEKFKKAVCLIILQNMHDNIRPLQ